jgi:hypothetical protein
MMGRHGSEVMVLVALTTVATACASSAASPELTARAVDPASVAVSVPDDPSTPPGPTTTLAVRSADVTDVATLATQMSAGTTGDPSWIPVMAELRARSWLATRYPGHYDLTHIYAEEWVTGHPRSLERELLDLGVYLDEPLPSLLSVVRSRTLGELVELDVVVEGGAGHVRQNGDDLPVRSLPGGRARGLFMVGPSGPGGTWRIHAVTELTGAAPASQGEEGEGGGQSP